MTPWTFPGADARFVASAATDDARARRFTRLRRRREACVEVFGGRPAQGLGPPLAGRPGPDRPPYTDSRNRERNSYDGLSADR